MAYFEQEFTLYAVDTVIDALRTIRNNKHNRSAAVSSLVNSGATILGFIPSIPAAVTAAATIVGILFDQGASITADYDSKIEAAYTQVLEIYYDMDKSDYIKIRAEGESVRSGSCYLPYTMRVTGYLKKGGSWEYQS